MKTFFASRPCLSVAEIRDYLRNELSSASQHEVENHLLDCELCTAAVEGYANAHNPAAVERDIQHLQGEIAREKAAPNPAIGLMRRLTLNRVAAAVLLFIIAGAAWLYWDHTSDTRLYASYFTHGPSHIVNLRSANAADAAAPELLEAIGAYDLGNYPEAIAHFENYLATNPQHFEAKYYAGIAHLEANHLDRAQDYLQEARINDPRLYEEASWFLALAELKAGKNQDARRTLQELIKGGNGDFREEAEALLEKME